MKNDNIFEYLKKCVVDNYVNFSGRARRMEFWSFQLVVFLISIALNSLNGLIPVDLSLLTGAFSIAMLLPSLAVISRRLHDVGKTGLMLFVIFIGEPYRLRLIILLISLIVLLMLT